MEVFSLFAVWHTFNVRLKSVTNPTHIPVRVDWPKSEWKPHLTVGELINDERFYSLHQSWRRELSGSEPEKEYLQFLFTKASIDSGETLSVEAAENFFQAALDTTLEKDSKITSVAIFEILSVAEQFGQHLLEKLPSGSSEELDEMISMIGRGSIFWQLMALRHHMGDPEYDVFICHASEDKEGLARPLAEQLRERGLCVWYDEYVLKAGDSLRRGIDKGLASCHFGIVVLSSNFFSKQWPQRELDGLAARELTDDRKIVLPIWHDLNIEQVLAYSPPLADKVGLQSSDGVGKLADQIVDAIQAESSN